MEKSVISSGRYADSLDVSFAKEAESGKSSLITEFWDFLKHSKKWWLTPIILALLLVGLLVILGGSAAAPFIYTLF